MFSTPAEGEDDNAVGQELERKADKQSKEGVGCELRAEANGRHGSADDKAFQVPSDKVTTQADTGDPDAMGLPQSGAGEGSGGIYFWSSGKA